MKKNFRIFSIFLYAMVFLNVFITGCSHNANKGELSSLKNFDTEPQFLTSEHTQDLLSIIENGDKAYDEKSVSAMEKVYKQQGPGEVIVPILLYHHILNNKADNIYTVSSAKFRDQMQYLKENNYSTIEPEILIKAIIEGVDLPEKPVLISFDDGNENVFLNAFPIMEEFDFSGTVYIISNRLNIDGFLSIEQINTLTNNGWVVGSHGNSHVDVVENPYALSDEVAVSKEKLEEALSIKITTFAYPFGKADSLSKDWVKRIGYTAGMGLGIQNTHTKNDIWYLSRRQVNSDTTLDEFIQLLSYN